MKLFQNRPATALALTVLVFGFGLTSNAVGADPTSYPFRFDAPVPQKGDRLGTSIADGGKFLYLGAPGAKVKGKAKQGYVALFERVDVGQTLTPAGRIDMVGGSARDEFGFAVALGWVADSQYPEHPYLAVAAPKDDLKGRKNAGSVQIFHKHGDVWSFETKLTAPQGKAKQRFGEAIATNNGGVLAVGAPRGGAGSVDIFEWNQTVGSWVHLQTLHGPVPGGRFGAAVALYYDTLIVGAPGTNEQRGAVFVYRRSGSTWSLIQSRALDGAAAGTHFGQAVDVDYKGNALVGAPGLVVDGVIGAGAAYFFKGDAAGPLSAPPKQALFAGVMTKDAAFGSAVSLIGAGIMIGAPGDSRAGLHAGATYNFAVSGVAGNYLLLLIALGSSPGERLGTSILYSYNGAFLAAGAPRNSTHAKNAGAGYCFNY